MSHEPDEWAVYQSRVPPMAAEWKAFVAATPIGSIVGGTVVSRHRFGAFIDLGWGTSCLGLVELPMLADPDADTSAFELPPVGTRIERAVVLGHRDTNAQVRLSARPGDLAQAENASS